MAQLPGHPPPCSICGTSRDRHEAVRGETCSKRSCQIALIHRQKRADHEALQAKCETIANEFAETQDIEDAIAQRVPYFSRQMAILPLEDSRAFRRRLREAFREAFQHAQLGYSVMEEGEDEPPSTLSLDATCIACRGFCCRQGSGHAFLEAVALRAIMLRHPSESPAALYRTYCRSIPEHSFAGSCLFQGERGCVLPRNRRAFICNDFECDDRTRLRDALTERPKASTLVIAMEGTAVTAAALTTAGDKLDWVNVPARS